jgi:hypothetical protein
MDSKTDEQIAHIHRLLRIQAPICTCMLSTDECRRCKLTARLRQLENIREGFNDEEDDFGKPPPYKP